MRSQELKGSLILSEVTSDDERQVFLKDTAVDSKGLARGVVFRRVGMSGQERTALASLVPGNQA